MLLYINACVRQDSRTHTFAASLLAKLGAYEEVKLAECHLKPLDVQMLEKRTSLIAKGDYSDSMFDFAKQFAAADEIVISAPYYDLSFPSLLKIYIENIYVTGLVSSYSEKGVPVGLCKARRLHYVVTAGGPYDGRFSYDYIACLAKNCFGIPETKLYVAENLDIWGSDASRILRDATEKQIGR